MKKPLLGCWAAITAAVSNESLSGAPISFLPQNSAACHRAACPFLSNYSIKRGLYCITRSSRKGPDSLTQQAPCRNNPPRLKGLSSSTTPAFPVSPWRRHFASNCLFLEDKRGLSASGLGCVASPSSGPPSQLSPTRAFLQASISSPVSPSAVSEMENTAGASVTGTVAVAEPEKQQQSLVLRPSKEPKEKRRLDYKPTEFLIDKAYLDFKLHPEETCVTSRLSMRRRAGTPPAELRLDGEGLELKGLWVDGKQLSGGVKRLPKEYYLDAEGNLYIPSSALPEEADKTFEIMTKVSIHPKTNLKLSGLYMTNDLFCTQCEAEGFRRITYYLDRPDVMALFTVRLEADISKFPTLLSNGNRVEGGPVEGGPPGHHFAVFEDPHKKPCYLFALVAGPLASVKDTFTTMSGKTVKVEVFSEGSETQKLAFALESVKRSMAWDEQTFGLEYDLDVFNIVCVRDFNMGAMENKGLNIFNSSLLLADPKSTTDAEYERILGVVGHEYFHNWTGNRVTCRDWFQLTLKEGLTVFRDQLFSAAMGSAAVKRIQDVSYLRAHQFPEDSGPMSHPIRPESYVAMDNFYTLTVYEKGAEVIRMMHTLLGAEGFRKGMDLYFKRHDGEAVTCDDFQAAMADASARDFTQFGRWYCQAGTPEVEVIEHSYDASAKVFTLRLRQRTPPTPGQPNKLPVVIPVKIGLLGRESKTDLLNPSTQVLEFTEEEQTFVFKDILEPCIPSLFRDFSSPVKVLPWQPEEDIAFLMAYDSDAFNRWQAANTLAYRLLLGKTKALIRTKQQEGDTTEDTEKLSSLSSVYKTAFKSALTDTKCDKSIKALTLEPPSFDVLAQDLSPIDPEALQETLISVRLELASEFKEALLELYRQLTLPVGTKETLDAENVARRRLRNVLLRMLSAPGDREAAERAYTHFSTAMCMTDRYAGLTALADMRQPEREKALKEFFEEAAGDPLMIDKWFRAQAAANLPDQVERVAGLRAHPSFTLKNPNRLRNLLSAFIFNRHHFHRKDGAGYKLIGDAVLEVDTFNPQSAASLAGSFLQWRRFDAGRQKLMQAQLERIRDAPGISPDTLEIVQRALKAAEQETKTE